MESNKIIRLSDGKKYIIANSIELNKRIFYHLLSVEDTESYIVERINNSITFIDDKDLILDIASKIEKNIING